MNVKLIGDRVIVKDNPPKENLENTNTVIVKQTDTPELISGVIEYGLQGSELTKGKTVWYAKTTGSTFMFNNIKYRSISKPLESIIFVEEN